MIVCAINYNTHSDFSVADRSIEKKEIRQRKENDNVDYMLFDRSVSVVLHSHDAIFLLR